MRMENPMKVIYKFLLLVCSMDFKHTVLHSQSDRTFNDILTCGCTRMS